MTLFQVGDVIETSLPFIHVLTILDLPKRCSWCFIVDRYLKLCGGCSTLRFCSVSCQKKAWLVHKYECPQLKKGNIPEDMIRLFFQLIVKYNLKLLDVPETENGTCFHDLTLNDYQIYPRIQPYVQKAIKYCRQFVDLPELSCVMELYAKLQTYAHLIQDENKMIRGVGLYLNTSKYEHSCVPNALVTYSGIRKRMIAIKPISSAEKLTITVVDLLRNKDARNAALTDFSVTCRCPRCLDDSFEDKISSTKCPGCITGKVDRSNKCDECGTSVDEAYKLERTKMLSDCRALVSNIENNFDRNDMRKYISRIDQTVNKWNKILPVTNILYLQLKYIKSCLLVNVQDCGGFLSTVEPIFPGLKMMYGLSIQLSLCGIQVIKYRISLKWKVDVEFYKDVMEMVSITHGKDSEYYNYLKDHKK